MVRHWLRLFSFISLFSIVALIISGCAIDYSVSSDSSIAETSQCEISTVCPTLLANSIALLSFDKIETGAALDSTINGHNATLSNINLVDETGGFRGAGLSFTGTPGERATIIDNSDLNDTEFAISLWFKVGMDSQTKFVPLISKHNGAGSLSGYFVGVTHMKNSAMGYYPWLQSKDTSSSSCTTQANNPAHVGKLYKDDQWHHIVLNWKMVTNEVTELYVDGELFDSCTNPANPSNLADSTGFDLLIGDSSDSWWGDYYGSIDEVYIFNRNLSAEEIQYLSEFSLFE